MLKVESEAAQVLIAKVHEAGQDHVLAAWDELTSEQRKILLNSIRAIDFQLLKQLLNRHLKGSLTKNLQLSPPQPAKPIPLPENPDEKAHWEKMRHLGEEAIQRGEIAVLLAAGLRGERIGISGPQGLCPIGPISQKTLFQLQTEQKTARYPLL